MIRPTKILSAPQIRALDTFTIENEPISSIDLMERASQTFVNWFVKKFSDTSIKVYIFCGQGNNGGDGLAIGRILQQHFYEVELLICKIGNHPSEDFSKNKKRLPLHENLIIHEIEKEDTLPEPIENGIIIDAIFGSGLNRSVEGFWAKVLKFINQQNCPIVAVDLPSGMFADQHTSGHSIHADYSFSFELPKLAFLFPENANRTGEWTFGSIQLHPNGIAKAPTHNFYLEKRFIQNILKSRAKYAHKGTFGHALLIAGSLGKVGAAILAGRAALRSGCGLVTIHSPKCAYDILQSTIPEAMADIDEHEFYFSKVENLEKYSTIGIGCGLDTKACTVEGLEMLLKQFNRPIVLDADALNIISQHPHLFELIPPKSILTPHPKEFQRLFGIAKNDFERNELQRHFSKKYDIYITLKGAHTCISTPEGDCFFNSTGNPGMATGGSGDVLTGILTSLLAQGYNPLNASILGVFTHGLTGDIFLEKNNSWEALIAGDLIDNLGAAFYNIRNYNT